MSGGTDKQVIIWKTNFARNKGNKENKKVTQTKKRESVQKRDIYDRIQNDVATDVGARLGQPGLLRVVVLKTIDSQVRIGPRFSTYVLVIETKSQEVESVETEQIETRDISPAVENTMKQMLRQMDVLTNTVRLLSFSGPDSTAPLNSERVHCDL